ncbi:MAG: hypothetical protein HOP12_15855 [Candidatus Eisenbacteria bacterium]|uniref:Uncharacterized protein n=1 Tax=Eiseniibacteriota bacterium TaxID=2212470 RepID=A0A849T2W3_UNCEI|nr:hypothetical protein [Candidatus Eisenbacteria bacterium]
MNNPLVIVGVLVVVAVLAFWMRRAGARDDLTSARPDSEPDDAAAASERFGSPSQGAATSFEPSSVTVLDDDEPDTDSHIAITSEGLLFLPSGHGVLIGPEHALKARAEGRPVTGHSRIGGEGAAASEEAEHLPTVMFSAGDLVVTRIRRGAPDLDPWRLEALGRDRDLQMWSFETREGAEVARTLLDARVVRPPLDEHGEPIPFGDEDFFVAERELERTLNELTSDFDDETRK